MEFIEHVQTLIRFPKLHCLVADFPEIQYVKLSRIRFKRVTNTQQSLKSELVEKNKHNVINIHYL